MSNPGATLVFFAVKEEAKFFKPSAGSPSRVLVTGMGKVNARASLLAALEKFEPQQIITAGFAGGLNPALKSGQIVFSAPDGSALEQSLLSAGARPAAFHCSDRVATNRQDKQRLRESTGADAVEMESGVIRSLCQERRIPCAIVRVILDTAEEDLPLDFNLFLRPDQTLDLKKVVFALLKAPRRIPGLLRLQRQSRHAAAHLGQILTTITAD